MMRRLNQKTIYLITCLTIILLLGNQALACILPSATEMGEGKSMACCTEQCRLETTPQAAQQACEQSRSALTQYQFLAEHFTPIVKIAVKDLSDTNLGWQQNDLGSIPIFRVILITPDKAAIPYRFADLYIFTHSLLL